MDNSAALLLKCCDHIERKMLSFGHDVYTILNVGNESTLNKLDKFMSLLMRTREYIFLGLYTQARRGIAMMQLLSKQVIEEIKS